MGSERYPLRNAGIYCNLPTFDPSITGLKAMIVGATGISGSNTMRSLLDSETRWSTIYAVSRSPPTAAMMSLLTKQQQDRIVHVSIDLSSSSDDIADKLRKSNVRCDYIFYYGYIHPWGKSAMDPAMADELIRTNVPAFVNFLQALPSAAIRPKRILLQTGGKHYGGHIGRARIPFVESDPAPKHLQDNFYYHQEEALFKFCEEHPETGWNVVRPFAVIGAAPNAGMSAFLSYAIMAAVQAQKNEPVFFGGDIEEWQYGCSHSSARLTGYLSEWAVLEEKCHNQAFNASDGSPLTFDRLFEELARWYNVTKGVEGPSLDDSKFKMIELAGGEDSPLGYGPPSSIRLSRPLAEWAEEEANAKVWKQIMEASSGQTVVDHFEISKDTFIMGDFNFIRIGPMSHVKLRKFGFNGFVDSLESIFEMYEDMAVLGHLPPPAVQAARPLI